MHRNGTDQKCTVKWNPLKVQTKCSGRKQSITEIYLTLKGTPSEDASWLENRKKCAKISICRLHTVDLFIIHATEVLFWVLQILIPLGAPMFVHSLPMNSRKRFAHDVMYTSATQRAGLIHDVTDTGSRDAPSLGVLFNHVVVSDRIV